MRFSIFFCSQMNLIKTLFADFLIYAYICKIINQNHLNMHLYRFFNPSAEGADSCVIIVSATNVEAINAYVDRYHHGCHRIVLSKDIHRDNAIIMEQSIEQLNDGVVIFSNIFAIEIS